jgi:hypothetical protein
MSMSIKLDLTKANEEAAVVVALGTGVALYGLESFPLVKAISLAVLAGLAVLGYTGTSTLPVGA